MEYRIHRKVLRMVSELHLHGYSACELLLECLLPACIGVAGSRL